MEWKFRLPKEFADLEKDVNNTLNTIQKLQNEIDSLGTDKGPRPEPAPPSPNGGYGSFKPNPDTEKIKKGLEAEQGKLYEGLNSRVNSRLEGLDKEQAKQVRNSIDRAVYPTGEMAGAEKEEKPLERSEDAFRKQIYDHQDKQASNTAKIEKDFTDQFMSKFSDPSRFDKKEEAVPDKTENPLDKASEKFMDKLNQYRDARDFAENKKDITQVPDDDREP